MSCWDYLAYSTDDQSLIPWNLQELIVIDNVILQFIFHLSWSTNLIGMGDNTICMSQYIIRVTKVWLWKSLMNLMNDWRFIKIFPTNLSLSMFCLWNLRSYGQFFEVLLIKFPCMLYSSKLFPAKLSLYIVSLNSSTRSIEVVKMEVCY